MIIYASPKSGKTSFVKNNPGWLDSDVYLFAQIKEAFGIDIIDNDTKGNQLLSLFRQNRGLIENVYTSLMYWIQRNKEAGNNVLIGSRRFMWLADKVFIRDTNDKHLLDSELQSALKWNVKYIVLKKGEFIEDKIKELVI